MQEGLSVLGKIGPDYKRGHDLSDHSLDLPESELNEPYPVSEIRNRALLEEQQKLIEAKKPNYEVDSFAIEQTKNHLIDEMSGQWPEINKVIKFIEDQDAEHPEVSYHNKLHVFSMAAFALESWRHLMNKSDIDPELKKSMLKKEKAIVASALLHDTGYYKEANKTENQSTGQEAEVMKVNHELISIENMKEMAEEFGISEDVDINTEMIKGTMFSQKLKTINLEQPINLSFLTEKDKESFYDKRVAEIGQSLLGTLDLVGTDPYYPESVRGLWSEFLRDVLTLGKQLAPEMRTKISSAVSELDKSNWQVGSTEDYKELINNLAQIHGDLKDTIAQLNAKGVLTGDLKNKADEFSKIPLAKTSDQQINNTDWFFEHMVQPRIQDAVGTPENDVYDYKDFPKANERKKSSFFIKEVTDVLGDHVARKWLTNWIAVTENIMNPKQAAKEK